ncbi:MAG: hypothetical protein LBS12_02425 [Prevotellaceae bacterium]|nr:hypothetical protein [Prevotellaceae bacterium]
MLAVIAALLLNVAGAQNDDAVNTFTPYSLYGVGDLASPGFSFQRAMGGLGIGLRTNRAINYINPASLSVQDTLSFMFDFGGEMQNYYLSTADQTTASNSLNMHHLAMSFPVWRKMVLAVSVMPYSSVGYNITEKETDPAVINTTGGVTYTNRGEGGLNQVMMSAGLSLHSIVSNPFLQRFSIGGEAHYIFGSIDRYSNVSFASAANAGVNSGRFIRASDFAFGVGLQYEQPVGAYGLTVGATYQFQNNMRAEQTSFRHVQSSSSYSTLDTTFDTRLFVPSSFGVGITLHHGEQWLVGLDYTFRDWTNATFDAPSSKVFKARPEHIVRAGFERTPNRYDIRYFLKRWSYRAGLYYEQTYLQFDHHRITAYGLTAGVGIPIGNRNNALNFSAEIGQRGTTDNGLVRELYWKLTLGVSLYDIWFVQPRFE